jgi:hypothetical protein
MKKIFMGGIILLISFMLVGCGSKIEYDVPVNGNENTVNDKTKVGTIAQSYEKYVDLKSDAYNMLSNQTEEGENYNFSLSMGLLGFSTLDLTLVPLTFCGLEDEAAIAGLAFLYKDIDYKSTDDSCKITFKSEDSKMTYDTKYDKKSDSVQTKLYENDKLIAISEYVKLNKGYATQYYSIEEESASIYKSIFDDERIIVGMNSDVSEPESIFKNESLATEEWTKSQELWTKYENGTVTSIYDGVEY